MYVVIVWCKIMCFTRTKYKNVISDLPELDKYEQDHVFLKFGQLENEQQDIKSPKASSLYNYFVFYLKSV